MIKARLALIKPFKPEDRTESKENLRIKLMLQLKELETSSIENIINEYKKRKNR